MSDDMNIPILPQEGQFPLWGYKFDRLSPAQAHGFCGYEFHTEEGRGHHRKRAVGVRHDPSSQQPEQPTNASGGPVASIAASADGL